LSLAFCVKLTDKSFSYLEAAEGLRNLIYLDLSGCQLITPSGTQLLARHCPKIQSLKVNNFGKLNDRHLKICTALSQLNEIVLLNSPQLTDEAFRHLSQATQLRVVKIASNRNLTDLSMKLLTKSCGELRHVSITDCERITDSTLKYLAACKNLVVLNMADCIRISDIGVKQLTEGVCVAKLRELNLTNCIRIGNQSMIALSKK
jgi:F-box/leucine-rich repeat protein 13